MLRVLKIKNSKEDNHPKFYPPKSDKIHPLQWRGIFSDFIRLWQMKLRPSIGGEFFKISSANGG
jgi:hypothetical protein